MFAEMPVAILWLWNGHSLPKKPSRISLVTQDFPSAKDRLSQRYHCAHTVHLEPESEALAVALAMLCCHTYISSQTLSHKDSK